MSSHDDLELRLRSWMSENAPASEPPTLVDRALLATNHVNQRPALLAASTGGLRRPAIPASSPSLRLVLVVLLVIALIAASAFVGSRLLVSPLRPFTEFRSYAEGTWNAAPRDVPGLGSSATTSLVVDKTGVHLAGSDYGNVRLDTDVRTRGEILEVTARSDDGCSTGDVGHYAWHSSLRSSRLTLMALDDACAARPVAFAGTWYRRACQTDGVCWGSLEAGRYPSQLFAPRLPLTQPPAPSFGATTFTLPDGWAVGDDWTSNLRLTPSDLYERERETSPPPLKKVEAWIRPEANAIDPSCTSHVDPVVGRTPAALVEWIRSLLPIRSADPIDVVVDGRPGRSVDIELAATSTTACPFYGGAAPLSVIAEAIGPLGPVGNDPYTIDVLAGHRMRLVFVDLGGDQTVLFVIETADPAAFEPFVTEAMPIVESFHFAPAGGG